MCPVRQEAAFGTAASKDASGGQVLLLARPPLKCVQCGRRLSTVCGVGCSAGLLRCVQCSRMPFLRFRKCIRWSRRLFSAPLKMRSVHQEGVSGTEYPSRTRKACFLHRMLLKMRRVPQEAFLSTECVFRTVEACFWYGALPKTHRTWLSGAQKSGWQLPLRGLSTPGRGSGRVRQRQVPR